MTQHHDSHDHGLAHDLPRMLGRRRLLAVLGGLGLASASGTLAAAAECIALPWETAGPYPADGSNSNRAGDVVNVLKQEGILREDLRASFGDDFSGDVDGVLLDLELTLLDAEGCTPLAGYAIYAWHCDGTGEYSLYDVTDANWLRGLAVADDEGKVKFTTIVPGCYPGRWPHIHFEIFKTAEKAVSGEASELTAQIALPESVVGPIYSKDDRYGDSLTNLQANSISQDNVFGDNTDAEIEQQTLVMTGDSTEGYRGSVVIPVDFKADRTVSMAPPPGGMPPGGKPGDMPPPPGGQPPKKPGSE
ncbi:hypothetical protein KM176_04620 [Pseudooceanicola sp. CBS1P-1]|uniref:Dioxygenase n=1 Tax=Pseudooceanicola albus TaxID=2692189 RepID=A0A6L7G5K7_9RHOB|nr:MULTISPECIES: dioxygenase [Pseudooceanicola]MBT9383133.1 hypothetical protein [Pseudooceanicola endophyticus]MXN19321.1 dioxygenase [Pseudooceanicola albus]